MRTLAPAPRSFLNAETGAPAFGSYRGPLAAVSHGRVGLVDRVARRKRWVYVAISSEEVWIALAIVRTGYAATAFGFAYDLAAKRMLCDRTTLGPAVAARVGNDPHAPGVLAAFRMPGAKLAVERRADGVHVHGRIGDLELAASLDERAAPPPITAIARLGERLFDATEKRALASVTGTARCGGRELRLDGATGGYDYTYGLLPRHTRWRWAFALGRDQEDAPFAFNVVEGFVGEAECAAFTRDGVHPLAEPRFELDRTEPMRPWRLRGDGVDLAFLPGAMHAEDTNLVGIVRSRFVQPVGTFSGTVRVGERDVRVASLPGVIEDQDVLW